MKKYYLVCLLIVYILNISPTQCSFSDSNENKNEREVNEKVNFPIKRNEDEINFKSLTNAWTNSLSHKENTNRIDEDGGSDEQVQPASKNMHVIILSSDRENKPLDKSKAFNTLNVNAAPFLNQKTIGKIRNSNEETYTDEREPVTFPTVRRTTSRAIQRIPPPSVVASAAERSTLRVCEIKYAEYIQRIFPQESDTANDANDKELNDRVLAAPGQYPHMTAIGVHSSTGKTDYKCGGSLISENFVITAAHCTNFTGLQPTKVRIGDLNLMVEESYLEPQIRNVEKIHVHPDYKSTSYYNDIAILELDKDIELTEFVRPIRLWTEETLPFTMAFAMGYGATDFARERTNRLTNLNMTIVPNGECNREMPKLPETDKGILSSQICARDYALNRDTCQGDSGGPLQLNISGRRRTNRLHYQLIGVTSYGMHCRSGYPSIFTRVCFYLDWIERIVWKDYFD